MLYCWPQDVAMSVVAHATSLRLCKCIGPILRRILAWTPAIGMSYLSRQAAMLPWHQGVHPSTTHLGQSPLPEPRRCSHTYFVQISQIPAVPCKALRSRRGCKFLGHPSQGQSRSKGPRGPQSEDRVKSQLNGGARRLRHGSIPSRSRQPPAEAAGPSC